MVNIQKHCRTAALNRCCIHLCNTSQTGVIVLSACKQPQAPTPTDEPDTARSVIHAVVNMNNITVQSLFVKNNDTLSNGKIFRREENNTWSVREGEIIKSSIYALNFKTAITISAIYNSNLHLTLYLNSSNRLDSLRSWDRVSFGFQFRIPENFRSGFTFTVNTSSVLDTLTVLEWIQSRGYEQELPSSIRGVTSWSIFTLFGAVTDIRYSIHPTSFQTSARVEAFQVTIDNYDLEKKRISGRFSFRVVGAINKEVIDIRDGVFENVQVYER